MKVQGNSIPEQLRIDLNSKNLAEIRIIENPIQIDENMYEYDEYLFTLPPTEVNRENILAHIDDWILTGRTIEINDNASEVRDMQKALQILGVIE